MRKASDEKCNIRHVTCFGGLLKTANTLRLWINGIDYSGYVHEEEEEGYSSKTVRKHLNLHISPRALSIDFFFFLLLFLFFYWRKKTSWAKKLWTHEETVLSLPKSSSCSFGCTWTRCLSCSNAVWRSCTHTTHSLSLSFFLSPSFSLPLSLSPRALADAF